VESYTRSDIDDNSEKGLNEGRHNWDVEQEISDRWGGGGLLFCCFSARDSDLQRNQNDLGSHSLSVTREQ
jgi:hypothetical protein